VREGDQVIQIECEAFDFKKDVPNRQNVITCKWTDIIHAAITVGRKNWNDVKRHGEYFIYEYKFRKNMVMAFLRVNRNNRIERTKAFHWLDPSEKTGITYFFGLMSAKLFASKLLNTPWLMHLDVYKSMYKIDWTTSKKTRPDLLGLNKKKDWNIIEAKGRINFSLDTLNNAKAQSENIKSINGKSPYFKLGLVSFFNRNELKIKVKDPEDIGKHAVDLLIDPSKYLLDYYAHIVEFIYTHHPTTVKYNDISYVVTKDKCLSWSIGLDERIYEIVLGQREQEKLFPLVNALTEWGYFIDEDKGDLRKRQKIEREDLTIGLDGVLVSL
jgi:hypothetical protein